jgi:hypothetical protein
MPAEQVCQHLIHQPLRMGGHNFRIGADEVRRRHGADVPQWSGNAKVRQKIREINYASQSGSVEKAFVAVRSRIRLAPLLESGSHPQCHVQANKKEEAHWKLMEARRDYAWGYFSFHAQQRTTMFNFYLALSGFVVGGFAALISSHIYWPSLIIALLGVVSSIIFLCLDHRNEELLLVAEDVLASIEKEALFGDEKRETPWPRHPGIFGWIGGTWGNPQNCQTGIFLREQQEGERSPWRHGLWIPVFLCVMLCAYGLAAVYSFIQILP